MAGVDQHHGMACGIENRCLDVLLVTSLFLIQRRESTSG
jgi:hypothetical protein